MSDSRIISMPTPEGAYFLIDDPTARTWFFMNWDHARKFASSLALDCARFVQIEPPTDQPANDQESP